MNQWFFTSQTAGLPEAGRSILQSTKSSFRSLLKWTLSSRCATHFYGLSETLVRAEGRRPSSVFSPGRQEGGSGCCLFGTSAALHILDPRGKRLALFSKRTTVARKRARQVDHLDGDGLSGRDRRVSRTSRIGFLNSLAQIHDCNWPSKKAARRAVLGRRFAIVSSSPALFSKGHFIYKLTPKVDIQQRNYLNE